MKSDSGSYQIQVILSDQCVKNQLYVVVIVQALACHWVTAKATHSTYIASLFSITPEEGGGRGRPHITH